MLPTIKLGEHSVSRLIIGGNPIYGYSHFNRILSQYQTLWHTPERVIDLLKHAESKGINTWQNSYAQRTLSDLEQYRQAAGKMHWLCLGTPDWDQNPRAIEDAAKHKPIGIAPHGALGERLHRQNKLSVLADLLKRIRDFADVRGTGEINTTIARDALKLLDIDEHGFDDNDRKLLRAIIERFGGGPVGVNTIAAVLSEEVDAIEDIYEPYLLQIGFLQRTPRGRIASKLAYDHLGIPYRPPQAGLF